MEEGPTLSGIQLTVIRVPRTDKDQLLADNTIACLTASEPIRVASIKAEILNVLESNSTRIACDVRDMGDGTSFEISIHLCYELYRLYISIDGVEIQRCPLVTVKTPVQYLGRVFKKFSCIPHPNGVAVKKNGEVIVTGEYDNDTGHFISVYSCSGEKYTLTDAQNENFKQIIRPQGVAVDSEDNILVAGETGLVKLSSKGDHLIKSIEGKFKSVCENSKNGKVYAVDETNRCICILNSDLTRYKHFGSYGRGDKGLHQILRVTCMWQMKIEYMYLHQKESM